MKFGLSHLFQTIFVSALMSSQAQAFSVRIHGAPKGIDVEPIFFEALDRLPPGFSKILEQGLEIKIEDLGPLPPSFGCDEKNASAIHGLVGRRPLFQRDRARIVINSRLFSEPIKFCRFGSRTRYIQSVFFHELAHVLDDHTGVTATTRYRGLASGYKAIHLRSPDAYENSSPTENFAVNFEFAMLDPHYGCRRPFMRKFIAEVTDDFSALDRAPDCEKNNEVILNLTGESASLDPDSIYQIQYLLAGPGSSLISKFGHSFFRIIVCAPERKTPGPDCLKDVEHHLVASFRALVPDKKFNLRRGLVGTYLQNVNFDRWSEVKTEYGYDEARLLNSYPLQLSRSLIRDFVDRLEEKYWSRFDRYSYTVNNCADEVLRQLQDILPSDHGLQGEVGATPTALLRTFERNGFIRRDGNKSGPPEAEMSYDAGVKELLNAENHVSRFLGRKIDFAAYQNLTDDRRDEMIQRLTERRDRAATFAFYVLEQKKFREDSRASLGLLIDAGQSEPEVGDRYARVKALNEAIMIKQRTSLAGYGIPLKIELHSSAHDLAIKRLIESRDAELIFLYAELAKKSPGDEKKSDRAKRRLETLTHLLL